VSESSEKTFDAPPSRIAKARREGNLPRAQEFGANLAFICASLATIAIAAPLCALARAAFVRAATSGSALSLSFMVVALGLVPMLVAALSGLGGGIVQNGGLMLVAPSLRLERLQPVEGIKRMFSREAATHGARAAVAFALASAAMLPTFHALLGASTIELAASSIASIAWSGAAHVTFAAAAVGTLFAIAEFAVARRAWLRKLRMSLAEFKRELKESDGDPLARSRRKALHRTLVRGAIERVKDAAFVVVNPTHVAVALEYRPPGVPVPAVLVRAADEMALRVRELAAEYRVPVIENVNLARALFRDGAVGEPIAGEHYLAVAEVVIALMRSGVLS
jgi:flagellar biosynthesis protein FlhB